MEVNQELLEELKSTWEGALKPVHEQLEAESKASGEARAESKQEIERVQNRLDEIEVEMKKAALDTKEDKPGGMTAAKAAFFAWARKGDKALADEEVKAQLQIADDSAGGFLAPAEYSRELSKGVVEFSPVREVARVMQTSATSVKIPKRTGVFAAVWTASAGTRSETTGLAYGLDEIPTHELYALVDVENQLLEDSLFDLEQELNMEFAEQFGVAEGAAMVNGTGVGKPEGFLQNASVTGISSATSDVLGADDVVKLYYELKTAYAKNATWAALRSTIRAIRLLKDTTNQYLWQPGLAGLAPAVILDRPYVEMPDMPAIADAAKALAIGDFRRAYRVVDRIVMSVQRDPYTQNTAGATRFIARKRVGGQVVNPEAIKVLTIA